MAAEKTVAELMALGDAFLVRHGVEEARVACELLVARLLRCGRLDLFLHADAVLPERLVEALRRGLRRLAAGEPVQYVIGQWEFRGLSLNVDRRALIPRPETEQLVDLVLQSDQAKRIARPLVVEVGAGSGCVILSLAQEMADGVFLGLDISPEALELARENARLNGLEQRVWFAVCDGCGDLDPASVDILVSNPPYIPTAMLADLAVRIRDYEPRLALDGGADGLTVYRSLLLDAAMALKPGGGIFLEIGDDQGRPLSEMLDAYGFSGVAVSQDRAGRDRFARGTLSV